MTFAIYDKKSGPAPPLVLLWAETHPAVVVDQGQFSVQRGRIDPFAPALACDVPGFLGITVGSDSENVRRDVAAGLPSWSCDTEPRQARARGTACTSPDRQDPGPASRTRRCA